MGDWGNLTMGIRVFPVVLWFVAAVLGAGLTASGAGAQNTSSWPSVTVPSPGNVTVVPRAPGETKSSGAQPQSGATQVTLVALLTQDGQKIDQGVVWRVFQDTGEAGDANRRKLVSQHREANPVLRLQPGDYIVNAAFGRAHLTRRITVKAGVQSVEPFVLNAGGLRLTALVGNGEPAPPNTVTYEIYSDERDQAGNRTRIMGGAKPGLIMRLNSGIYQIVSTYGDANAQVRADVTVEAGKLTDVTVAHAAAKVTLKLVTRAGGEALADTQWNIQDTHGEVIKESVGALPTHTLAPGTYVVNARSAGRVYRREFTVQHGEVAQVEVVIQ
jgi:hypothetical protein